MLLAAALSGLAAAAPVPARRLQHDHGDWELMPASDFQATIALGISMASPLEGIIIGGENGAGAQVWSTEDGGRVFRPAILEGGEAPALMLLDGDIVRDDSVASGIFAAWGSQDRGRSYRPAEGLGAIGPAQSVDGFIEGGEVVFVITGETILFNGVSVSRDGGRTFAAGVEVFEDKQTTAHIGARYGAFPAADAWYVSGGRFPSSADLDDGAVRLSENIHLEGNSTQLKFTKHSSTEKAAAHRRTQLDPYTAGIAKSEDQ